MDKHRKSAYRYMIYWALLDIRSLAWIRFNTIRILNPMYWKREMRRIHRAGVIADYMHNLAMFSAVDFAGFDEGRFWRDLEDANRRHPQYALMYYKERFDRKLAEFQQEDASEEQPQ